MIGAWLESGEAGGGAKAVPGARPDGGAARTEWAGLESSTADGVGLGAWPVDRGVAMSGAWPSPQLTGRHFVGAGSPAPPGAVPAAGVARARSSVRAAPPCPPVPLGM